ncbi:Solute carrier family 35 member G1 [Halotydeus destructor]|nr:Solute carrier family 35 member G1 [Halotydeus destructor]
MVDNIKQFSERINIVTFDDVKVNGMPDQNENTINRKEDQVIINTGTGSCSPSEESTGGSMSDINSVGSRPKFAFKGILLSMLSSVFFTLTAVIVKYLKDVHPGQTACFRFLGILLFTIPMVITANVNPLGPKEKRHFLILRGLAGASSLYLRYSALHYMPIANATVIVLSMPVFVCIFARIFLKEACGLFHLVAIGVTLVGIAFTSNLKSIFGLSDDVNQEERTSHLIGLGFSFAATLVGSFAYIFVRLVKDVHHSVILFNFSLVALMETSFITVLLDGFKFQECGLAPWLLVALAILSFYAQLLLTKALQIEEASLVAVTRASMEVVCAFIFQIVIFHHVPDWSAFVGAVLVFSAVMMTTARKWVLTLPDGHWGAQYLWFTTR